MNYRFCLFIHLLLSLICGLSFVSLPSSTANSANCDSVQEIIRQDTEWTLENSPYTLQGKIQVDTGVTLTVAPGVHIVGNGCPIQLWGNFIAVGTQNHKIEIENADIFQMSPLDNWKPESGYRNLSISYARFRHGTIQILLGELELQDSYLEEINLVFRNSVSSLVYIPENRSLIVRNVFVNPMQAISIEYEIFGKLEIQDNSFYPKQYLGDLFYIRGLRNQSFIDEGAEVLINHNNFFYEDGNVISISESLRRDVDATQNYWSITDDSQIQDRITDGNDGLEYRAYVEYTPFLLTSNENAPVLWHIFLPRISRN